MDGPFAAALIEPAQLQAARRVLPLQQVRGGALPGVPRRLQEEAGAQAALQDEAPRSVVQTVTDAGCCHHI